jgi:UDP-N-acetylglucosamine 1-carboxyvinyltransferase
MPIIIEGNVALRGTVHLSGAKNSALKLVFASLYSNDNIVLDNVPRLESISDDMEIVKSIGGKAEWIGNNKLLLNGSGVNSYEIPYELGSKYRTAFLLAGPLLYRFGKANIPKPANTLFKSSPVNRILYTWKTLGFEVSEDDQYIRLSAGAPKPAEIVFKTTSHTGTDNAIISSLFIAGETTINNASEEPEVDDLVNFAKLMGANVNRIEPRKIKVTGTTVFRGGTFEVMPDKFEAAAYSTAAILTKGNVVIKNINKLSLVPFVNFLSKIGANFELGADELKVWGTPEHLKPSKVTIAPSPGFVPDWAPLATLLLTDADDVSFVHDTVYTDKFNFVRDLNRMGADIELIKPGAIGIVPIISDDSYDFDVNGEPFTVAKITGPSKLKGEKIHIIDPRFANTLVLAALAADGKTEIYDYKSQYESTELFFDKLISLGAKIKLE